LKSNTENISDNSQRLSVLFIVKNLLYPITSIISNPIQIIRIVINSALELNFKDKFLQFDPKMAINNLFYWRQSISIKTYGLDGISPFIGLNGYKLQNWFHLTLASSHIYRKWGSLSVIVASLMWFATSFLWQELEYLLSVLFVLAVTFNSTFYTSFYRFSNYNILGWCLFPLFIFAFFHKFLIFSAIVLLAISFLSFTAAVLGGAVLAFAFLSKLDPVIILTGLPTGLKLLSHFGVYIKNMDFSQLKSLSKMIGLSKTGGVKYRRTSDYRVRLNEIIWLLGIVQYIVVLYYFGGENLSYSFLGLAVFFINKFIARFADGQTIWLFNLSIGAALLAINFNLILLASFWVMANPHPWVLNLGKVDVLPVINPYNLSPLLNRIASFLDPVNENSRVLMAYEDPGGIYEKCFDGYRVIWEAPLYVATEKNISLFPDWYAIEQNNYQSAPNFWGRTLEEVSRNVDKWNLDYVIIYTVEDNLDSNWESHGYTIQSVLNLADITQLLNYKGISAIPIGLDYPIWWLLKVPDTN